MRVGGVSLEKDDDFWQAVKGFGWLMKLFLFFADLVFRIFFRDRVLFVCGVTITIFTEHSLSFFFSICFFLGVIEEKEKTLEAKKLSQPAKNHQRKEVIFLN